MVTRCRIYAGGYIVFSTSTDSKADREQPAAQHVAGRQTFRQHHRVVKLCDDNRSLQLYAFCPCRASAEQRHDLRVVKRHPLSKAQRAERAFVHGTRPCLQHDAIHMGLHQWQSHTYLHNYAPMPTIYWR